MPQRQPRGLHDDSQVTPGHFAALGVIATVAVVARVFGRRARGVRIWADDYLIIATLLVQYLILATAFVAVHYDGLGKDAVDAVEDNPEAVVNLLKCNFAFCLTYALCSSLVKVSVLALYWRMFPTRAVRIGACVLGAMCIGWFIAVVLATVFQCKPTAKVWNASLEGECIDRRLFFVGKSIPNCALDLMVLLLPTREIVRLDLPMRKKIAVGCVFLLGGFVVAAGAFRLAEAVILYRSGLDNIKQFLLPWFAAAMEISLAIIAVCLPTLMPTFCAIHEHWMRVTGSMLPGVSSAGGETKGSGTLSSIMTIGGRVSNHNRFGALTTVESGAAAGRSFVRLDNFDSDVEGLTPKGYSYERQTRIGSTRVSDRIREEPIPLDGIVVKRDMSWAEGRKL